MDRPEERPKADVVDRAVYGVLALIRERRLSAGERIASERELSERLGITRHTVREALSILESLRVVIRKPNSGVFVRDLEAESSPELLVLQADLGFPQNREDVRQAMEVRAVLEIESVRIAAERRTIADLAKLENIMASAQEKIERSISTELEDEEFHLAIAAATHNSILQRIISVFYLMSRSRRVVYFSSKERNENSWRHHKDVFDALVKGDSSEAVTAMRRHLDAGSEAWKKIIEAD